MASKLFVGNLPFTTTENDLQDYFGQVGQVLAVNIMQDRATGRSRGFAFVEMQSQDDAAKAITQLQFLVEASQVLNSTLDLAELLDLIMKLARREIGADRGTVYLVDSLGHVYVRWDDGGVLRLVMAEDQWRRVS